MLSKFLDPKNDVAFKKIFGSEKNKDILIHFLNDMLVFKEKETIKDVTFLKTIQDPEIAAHKTSIVDILAKDNNGHQYIVGMQVAKEKGFEKRAQYYAAKAYTSQAHSGGKYHDLKEVIFLTIADFVMFPHKKTYKSDHVTLNKHSHDHDLKGFSFTFIELPKFDLEIKDLDSILEKWTYFFKHAGETSEADLSKIIGSDQIIERAYSELNRFSWDETELLSYDQAEKCEWTHIASMDQKFDERMAKGRAKGMQKEMAKGKAEGEKIGLKKAAQKMLNKGMSFENIRELTGLSVAEIGSLSYLNLLKERMALFCSVGHY